MPRLKFSLSLLILLLIGSFFGATASIGRAAAGVEVTFGDLVYTNENRTAEIVITVKNVSESPAISGGAAYFVRQQDGNLHWVTLLGVIHDFVPIGITLDPEYGEAPLWRAYVTFDDGRAAQFLAGCRYLEVVHAEGAEPAFTWEVDWPGGWMDCGNSYKVNPPDLAPGTSASSPLIIYNQHPREWHPDNRPTRRVTSITISLWRADGTLLTNVATKTY